MALWCAIIAIAFCVAHHIHKLEASPVIPRFQQRHAILDTHNALRRKIALHWPSRAMASNMKKMKWDLSLAIQATVEATCDKLEQYLRPSGEDYMTSSPFSSSIVPESAFYDYISDEPQLGKNVAYTSNKNIKYMIQSWFKQQKNYSHGLRACKPGKNCGHFVQIAWAEANRVGCSYNPSCTYQGERFKFLVCLYNVAADLYKEPYKIGKSCSKCDSSAGFCEDGLCVTTCYGSTALYCECRKKCHHKGIGRGRLHKGSCSCTCLAGMGPDCEEECRNPAHYDDWDICAESNTDDACKEDSDWQKKWCPANCRYGCNRYST